MLFKAISNQEAIKKNLISQSILLFPSETIEFNGGGGNYHFADIFGKYHKAFHPYTHKTDDYVVNVIPNGYCFCNNEMVFCKNQEILTQQTRYLTHPLCLDTNPTNWVIRQAKKRVIFYKRLVAKMKLLFSKKIHGNVALLTRQDIQNCYGHLIVEVMAGYYQIQAFAKLTHTKIDYYILPTKLPFQKDLIKLLKIDPHKIIPAESKSAIQATNLIIPTLTSEYTTTEYRTYIKPVTCMMPRFIRNLYSDFIKTTTPTRKIYLKRPEQSNRNIINAKEVEKIFAEFGFEIVLSDILSLEEEIKLFSETKCLVSMHGSGLNNVIFMQEKTFVFEIFSQYYHDRTPQIIAFIKNIHYSYMVAETHDTSVDPQQENAYIRPNQLRLALKILNDKMQKTL